MLSIGERNLAHRKAEAPQTRSTDRNQQRRHRLSRDREVQQALLDQVATGKMFQSMNQLYQCKVSEMTGTLSGPAHCSSGLSPLPDHDRSHSQKHSNRQGLKGSRAQGNESNSKADTVVAKPGRTPAATI